MKEHDALRASEKSARRLAASRVRLIISIPTLTMLLTLATGAALYWDQFFYAQRVEDPQTRMIIERVADNLLGGTVLFSLVAALVGFILAYEIVRPIREFTESLEQIGSGNLTARSSIPTLGEFADLGITFNRMVDQLQRMARERNRILEGVTPGGVLWLGADGKVSAVDLSCARLLRRGPEDLIGRPLLDVFPGLREFADLKLLLRRGARPGGPPMREAQTAWSRIVEAPLKKARASENPAAEAEGALLLGIAISLMRDAGERPMGFLVVLRNLSALQSFHEQMARADRLAALGTFATGMAHEIRNPLASMKGMAQLLGDMDDEETQRQCVERIVSEINRLETLISEVMNFAQPEPVRPEPTDLNRLAREAMEVAVSRCQPEARQIAVRLKCHDALPECLLEPRRMTQALLNIIVNAFEATPDGGEVVIQTRHLSDYSHRGQPLMVAVSNTGEPIPEEERERIFEPFYTTKPKGTGLGLPIAYQIVSMNQGAMDLECLPGRTTFRIYLPLAQDDQAEE